LRDEGRCVLFSSHIMQEVAALCDRIVIVARGQVVAEAYHDFRNVIVGRDLEELFKDFDGVMDAIMENKELREEFFRFVAQENGRPNRGA
jgi:sodium transport system ATP-binding protein